MNAHKNGLAAGNSEAVESIATPLDPIEPFGDAASPDERFPAGYKDSSECLSLEEMLLDAVRDHCRRSNVSWSEPQVGELIDSLRAATRRWYNLRKLTPVALPRTLEPYLVAEVIICLRTVRRIQWSGAGDKDEDLFLADYDEAEGIYKELLYDGLLSRLARRLRPSIDVTGLKVVHSALQGNARKVVECADRNLIPMLNGDLDHRTKELYPHSPDRVFVHRFGVNWIENAELPVIVGDDGAHWDPESWMATLSDDHEVVQLLWEVVGALFRSWVLHGQVVAPYGEGRNGKGTLRVLFTNLCGGTKYAPNLPLASFAKDFRLTSLIGAVAVLGDENGVGHFLDDITALKSAATGDTLDINRKHRNPTTYTFRGMIYEPLNEYPKFGDRTYSLQRRFLFIPLLKDFTEGERPEIKEDYLARPEVLEYIAWKVLSMEYDRVSQPQAVLDLKSEMQRSNDPVVDFWSEFSNQFTWGLLPTQFVYDLYLAWMKMTNPSGRPLAQKTFSRDLNKHMDRIGAPWEYTTGIRPGSRMNSPESLIAEYDLSSWLNPSYTGTDQIKRSMPPLKPSYRGWVRTASATDGDPDHDSETTTEDSPFG